MPTGPDSKIIPSHLRILAWLSAALLGVLETWARRFDMNSDAIAYMDIGEAYFRGDWAAAVNSYWSPLYSWILGLSFWVAKPSPYWETTVAHFANLAVFFFALASFEFLLREILRGHMAAEVTVAPDHESLIDQGNAWVILSYVLFLYMSQEWVKLRYIGPDLLVAAFLFACAAMTLRARRLHTWRSYALLGAVLGLGFLSKTPMFIMAFVFLGVVAIPLRSPRAVAGALLAFAVFVATAGPYILAISTAKGRFTFGDSASLNFLVRFPPLDRIFQKPEAEYVQKRLFDSPPIYDVHSPPGVTFAPWNDPAGWRKDREAESFARSIDRPHWRANLENYYGLLVKEQGALLAALMALWLLSGRRWQIGADLLSAWPVLLPVAAGFGMFLVAHVEARYVAGFFVLLWVGLLASVRLPREGWPSKAAPLVLLGAALALSPAFPKTIGGSLALMAGGSSNEYWEAAEGLHHMGVAPGTRVAAVGHVRRAYWARLGQFRIVAEIHTEHADAFLLASPEMTQEMIQALASTGARAIVSDVRPGPRAALHWQRIGNTDYFVALLPQDVDTQAKK